MNRLLALAAKAWGLYRANGMGVLWRRVMRYLRRRGVQGIFLDTDNAERFRQWLAVHEPSRDVLRRMADEAAAFAYKPVIDVVMPVCDPEIRWLEAAVSSVKGQVYPHWQLCIADDASRHPEVRTYLQDLVKEDPRISVALREERGGISATSNAALSLATGEFACFLDHDDELTPHALFRVVKALNNDPTLDLIYSDECALEGSGRKVDPHFKPDFAPDLLMSMNYIGHLVVCRSRLLQEFGGLRSEFDGSQDYDLMLRLAEVTNRIHHIPDILYLWRRIPGSSSGDAEAKPYAFLAALRALEEAVERRGLPAEVTMKKPGRYRVRYLVQGTPLVSIIIPTRNRGDLLERCIASIKEKTTYRCYEIIVLDNGSDDSNTLRYLHSLADGQHCRVTRIEGPFNWSVLNNVGAKEALGEFLLFLNNDTEVLTPEWLEELVAQGQQGRVGGVGAKLLFQDGRIQHAGVVVGMGGVAGHAFYGMRDDVPVYMDMATVVRNVSAVTGACMLTRRSVFAALGGFREELHVAFNDVDYCLRLLAHGYDIIWTPEANLVHHESVSRRTWQPEENVRSFIRLWGDELRRDMFVNPHLDIDDCQLRVCDKHRDNPLLRS